MGELEIKKDKKENDILRKYRWMKAIIIILLFVIVLLIVTFICFFKLQNKCKEVEPEDIPTDVINDFGTRLDEFTIDKDEVKKVKVNGFFITIENRQDGVYINNRKINFMYASGGYVLDKFLILYTSYNLGNNLIFIDYALNEVSVEDNELLYSDIRLDGGKLVAKVSKYDSQESCKLFDELEICKCTNGGEPFTNYQDSFEDYNDEIIEAEIKLIYKEQKIIFEYLNKVTFGDKYGNNPQDYCVIKS